VARLEEIVYDAGRQALAEQEASVSGIRQRTGTLLAAHALVASFLGAAVIRAHGFDAFAWIALCTLMLGLGMAAVLLAPWELEFAVDARELYRRLSLQARTDAEGDELGWLVEAAYGYQLLCDENTSKVRLMSRLSGALRALMIVRTLAWLAALAVG
jgi:hypothetical protein